MFFVCGVIGVCSVMKSARASRSSSSTFSTPRSSALSGDRNGSNAMTRMRRPTARSATMDPMFPQPMMPSVLPVISTPMKRFFSHLPACVEASAAGISRASANIMAMACSAVVIELPKGVFITITPLRGRRRDVDIVDADAGASNDLQPGRRLKQLGGDLGGRADGEAVIVADDGGELRPCRSRAGNRLRRHVRGRL